MIEKPETLEQLKEYKKKAQFVLRKLHKEMEDKDAEIKILEQVNGILRAKLKNLSSADHQNGLLMMYVPSRAQRLRAAR